MLLAVLHLHPASSTEYARQHLAPTSPVHHCLMHVRSAKLAEMYFAVWKRDKVHHHTKTDREHLRTVSWVIHISTLQLLNHND